MKCIPQNPTLVFLPGGGLGHNFGVGPPQIKLFNVYYEALSGLIPQQIYLRWVPYPEADVVAYTVLRSIIGFEAPVLTPAALAGLTLQLKVDGGTTQTVAFNGAMDVITAINTTVVGGRAFLSNTDATKFFFRSDTRQSPGSVEIVGGTALTALGLSARTITQLSEYFPIAQVTAPDDPLETVEYVDENGSIYDYYALTTIDHLNNQSYKTSFKQAITDTGDICILEGVVTDIRGVRVPDTRVVAFLVSAPFSAKPATLATMAEVETLSAHDGSFSLALLQGAVVRIEARDVGYGLEVTVPAQSFANLTDLAAELSHKF